MKKSTVLIAGFLLFLAGSAAGFYASNYLKKNQLVNPDCLSNYKFINPYLGCDLKYSIKKTGYSVLRKKIQNYVADQKTQGKVSNVSVYFRDLVDGPWFGVGEGRKFSPASLLKLPVMITYFKQAEVDPSLLSESITYQGPKGNEGKQYYKPEETLQKGATYTIDDLIKRMIVFSDNRSSDILIDYLYNKDGKNPDPFVNTLISAGTVTDDSQPGEDISVIAYSSLFRLLFTGSYLTEDDSEKALNYLSQTKFDDGLVGGVPKGIKVAHKFGERMVENSGDHQLHDCGIVYFTENPYSICIMTEGKDFKDLSATIQHISKMVYDEVNSRKL